MRLLLELHFVIVVKHAALILYYLCEMNKLAFTFTSLPLDVYPILFLDVVVVSKLIYRFG